MIAPSRFLAWLLAPVFALCSFNLLADTVDAETVEAILEEGGDITVGRVGLSGDVGAARGGELCGAAAATGSLDRQSMGAGGQH